MHGRGGQHQRRGGSCLPFQRHRPDSRRWRRPAPDGSGFYNRPVTVSFNGTDATSGIESCSAPRTYSGHATGIVLTGACTDVAGNTASATFGPFNFDDTAPTAAITPPFVSVLPLLAIPLPVGVPLTGSAADSLSGVGTVYVTFSGLLGLFGGTTTRVVTCTFGCGTGQATWSVSTAGLQGIYTVVATSVDRAGNVGSPSPPILLDILL